MPSPLRRSRRVLAGLAMAACTPVAASACPSPVPLSEVAPAPSSPAACPLDMVLVDGDYCTEVEVECLRSTYAKQNKKTICHEFKAPARCVGSRVHKRYCVDRYEYPNKKGERPE